MGRVRLLLCLVVAAQIAACDYEKDACETALEVQEETCRDQECLLCQCINQGYVCVMDEQKVRYIQIGGVRVPDFNGSGFECVLPEDCTQWHLEQAGKCVEDEKYCTDWMYVGDLFLCQPEFLESIGIQQLICGG